MKDYLESIRIKKVEDTKDILALRIDNIDPCVVNAIRRTILSDTPTMAIEWVYIKENDSVMADEILAHRLGLLPVNADPEEFPFIEKPDTFDPEKDTNSANSIQMELLVTNTSKDTLSVYSDDIKIISHPYITIKPKILITRLAPKQKLECKMTAIKGTGREHSKWTPTSVCYYRCIKQAKILDNSKLPEIEKYFRSGLIKTQDTASIDENTLLFNMDVQQKHPDALEIKTLETSFIFEIEPILDNPQAILSRGIQVIQSKLSQLLKDTPDPLKSAE